MGLSEEGIKEFKQAYLEEYNEEISDAQAKELGENLITLFRIICRPIPEEVIRKYEIKNLERRIEALLSDIGQPKIIGR